MQYAAQLAWVFYGTEHAVAQYEVEFVFALEESVYVGCAQELYAALRIPARCRFRIGIERGDSNPVRREDSGQGAASASIVYGRAGFGLLRHFR